MLILTRRIGESVMIQVGKKLIEVLVTRIHGTQVALAFGADKDIIINREEIYERIKNEELQEELQNEKRKKYFKNSRTNEQTNSNIL